MKKQHSKQIEDELSFTGERFVPYLTDKYIVAEHFQRYNAVLDIVKGKKILDAACGTGYGTALMSSTAASATGIDISPEAIEYAKHHYGECTNAHYVEASIASLPFPDHSFDVIISFETIEHVDGELQNSFLREIKRCLREDGLLIMSSPDKRTYSDLPGFQNEFHIKEFYVEEFEAFLQQEFKYCQYFLQGGHNLAGEFIHHAHGSSDSFKLLNKMNYQRDNDLYVISICSNKKIDFKDHDISSIFCYEQIPSAYTFVDNTYIADNIIYPGFFEGGEICTVKFNLTDKKTDGRIRFDPVENACCMIELLGVDTDAANTSIVSLNHVKQEGNKYTFITIDPIIEILGDFSQATYLEIQYKINILDIRTVSLMAYDIFAAKQDELNAKQQEINNYQKDLEIVRQQLTSLRHEVKLITSTRGYKALEKIRAIRKKIIG